MDVSSYAPFIFIFGLPLFHSELSQDSERRLPKTKLGRVALSLFRRISWPRAVTEPLEEFVSAARFLCWQSPIWLKLDMRQILCALQKQVHRKGGALYVHARNQGNMFDGASGETIFYYSSDRESNGPAPQPSFASYEYTSWSSPSIHPLEELSSFTLAPPSADGAEESMFGTGYGKHSKIDQNRPFLILLPLALGICLRLLEGPFNFHELEFNKKGFVRGALRHQINEVCGICLYLCISS
jgi:hypothetical protein